MHTVSPEFRVGARAMIPGVVGAAAIRLPGLELRAEPLCRGFKTSERKKKAKLGLHSHRRETRQVLDSTELSACPGCLGTFQKNEEPGDLWLPQVGHPWAAASVLFCSTF